MRKLQSLLREARRHEQYGDLQNAISTYRKALKLQEEEAGVADLDIYNRLGDLYLRTGDPRSAVSCFQHAVQRHEEQHMYTNAIALCKKILRNAPDCTEAYHRAGQLQAKAGLLAEARDSYIEYANRMEGEGALDQALVALREFADSCEDEQIRLALADRYLLANQGEEALEQLRLVYRLRLERGDEVSEIRRRILEVDPQADPVASSPDLGPDAEELNVGQLAAELQEVLNGLEGEEKLRQALPVIDQLLQFEPEKVSLLQRKLTYALALDEEAVVIEAYLALGDLLAKKLTRFSLRFLTTSSSTGAVTCAVKVEEQLAAAPAD